MVVRVEVEAAHHLLGQRQRLPDGDHAVEVLGPAANLQLRALHQAVGVGALGRGGQKHGPSSCRYWAADRATATLTTAASTAASPSKYFQRLKMARKLASEKTNGESGDITGKRVPGAGGQPPGRAKIGRLPAWAPAYLCAVRSFFFFASNAFLVTLAWPWASTCW